MPYFVPADQNEHAQACRNASVPDYCRNCGNPFMDHWNGRCPEPKDDDEEDLL